MKLPINQSTLKKNQTALENNGKKQRPEGSKNSL